MTESLAKQLLVSVQHTEVARRPHISDASRVRSARDRCERHTSPLAPGPHTRTPPTTMNSFLTRYSSTSPEADIRKAKELFGEDEDVSDVMWGSSGGFGSLASGVPMFKLPSVQDVCALIVSWTINIF